LKMRALTISELNHVNGGSYFATSGGSGLVRYRVLGEGTCPAGTDCYVVRADQQQSGMFDDDDPMEAQCGAAFQFVGEAIGAAIGGMGSAAAVGLEVSVGVIAAPVTGGLSLSVTVAGTATGAAQVGFATLLGGFIGNQAGTFAGTLAC
jgi:hypothetical protein